MDSTFALERQGDVHERRYWPLFLRDHFASYEAFWIARIVPLTYRGRLHAGVEDRGDIGFRTTAELQADGFDDEDVAIAQLHYTLLLHLGRVFDLLQMALAFDTGNVLHGVGFDAHKFLESFARLSGASDVSDELLERSARRGSGTYPPWDEGAGRAARTRWRGSHPDPLQDVRAYRNRLVHGRVVPEWTVRVFDTQGFEHPSHLRYPKLNRVDEYLDWWRAFGKGAIDAASPDFDKAHLIVQDAWERTVDYAESNWREHLPPD